MKNTFAKLSAIITVMFVVLWLASCTGDKGKVRHVVVIKFSENAPVEKIVEFTNAFNGLKNRIPGIASFESGENISPENLNKNFTHIYTLTFESGRSRDRYLDHPVHKRFGDFAGNLGIIEDILVVDYTLN